MKFTKNNSIEKHLVHVVNEEFGSESMMEDKSKKVIDNKIEIVMSIEDNELLKDSLLSRKSFYGSHYEQDEFSYKLLQLLDREDVPDSRRDLSTLCSYHFASLAHAIDEVSLLLPPNTPIPCE